MQKKIPNNQTIKFSIDGNALIINNDFGEKLILVKN